MIIKTAKQSAHKVWALLATALVVLSSSTMKLEQVDRSVIQTHQEVDTTSLNNFTGYYRFPNRVAYIWFFNQKSQLVAQQTWDRRNYPLQRTGSLSFQSRDEAYQIAFIEGAEGKIEKAKILDRVVLEKVHFDPTRYIELTDEQLKPLVGRYKFQKDKNMEINVAIQSGKLILKQLWDNKILTFDAYSATDFINDELSFPLTFIVENGVVKELICLESDRWERVRYE